MILVIADSDAHTRVVVRRLRELGATVHRFDMQSMPLHARMSTWIDDGGPARVRVRRDDRTLDWDAVKTVWFRRLSPLTIDPSVRPVDADFVRRDTTAYLYGLGAILSERFCVNPIVAAMATDHGRGKVSQLEFARLVGMSVPRTIVTNDPDAARDFLEGCQKGAIYKPFMATTRNLADEGGPNQWVTLFTVKLDDVARKRLNDVRLAPCIFQELVPKRFDLRVTVIGNKVFGTEIHSQGHAQSAVDFRKHYALGDTPYVPHDVPAHLADKCRALNRKLELVFGAYDFVVTPDGDYVFLEVNQQGQFLWLEEQTGQPLLESFCAMLHQGRADYRCDALAHAPGRFVPGPPCDDFDVGETVQKPPPPATTSA